MSIGEGHQGGYDRTRLIIVIPRDEESGGYASMLAIKAMKDRAAAILVM